MVSMLASYKQKFRGTTFVVCVMFVCSVCVFGRDIAGIYLTHKDTPGGQAIVEIFKHNNKYYVYGLKNLKNNVFTDSCNTDLQLRNRKNVGTVFAYDYTRNASGEFVGGSIYNFHNCKTYYGKIVPKADGKIDFVGSLDSYYMLRRTYEWELLLPHQAKEYDKYRQPIDKLLQSIEDTRKSNK